MSIQAKTADGRLYDPNRDVAHNFKFVVMKVAKFFEKDQWPAITETLEDHGVTPRQISDGWNAYVQYVTTTHQHPKESIQEAMDRTGWDKVPDSVKIALQAYIGMVMTGMWYYAARDASFGVDKSPDAKTLVDEGARVAASMCRPLWKRRLSRAWHAVTKVIGRGK